MTKAWARVRESLSVRKLLQVFRLRYFSYYAGHLAK